MNLLKFGCICNLNGNVQLQELIARMLAADAEFAATHDPSRFRMESGALERYHQWHSQRHSSLFALGIVAPTLASYCYPSGQLPPDDATVHICILVLVMPFAMRAAFHNNIHISSPSFSPRYLLHMGLTKRVLL